MDLDKDDRPRLSEGPLEGADTPEVKVSYVVDWAFDVRAAPGSPVAETGLWRDVIRVAENHAALGRDSLISVARGLAENVGNVFLRATGVGGAEVMATVKRSPEE